MKKYPKWISEHPESRLAVYTVLFGDYDSIKPVQYKSPRCDYYIITDQIVDEKLGWAVLNVELSGEIANSSSSIKNRYYKMHPEVLFPQYEYSLYLDATMIPQYDLFPLLGRMGEAFLGMYKHSARDCIFEEAKTVVRIGKANENDVRKLIERYHGDGFPEHFGLTLGGIILRKHHDDECKQLMQDWWEMFLNGPKRDQLSLMYCLWKRGYNMSDIADLGIDYELEPRLGSQAHK